MRGRAWIVAAVSVFVWQQLHVSAWGIVRRDDVPDDNYTGYAALPQFAAVGKVFAGSNAGSGTVIANGWWVLTAAHVIHGVPVSSISFWIGASTYTAQNVYTPGYNPANPIVNDIALIELNAPVVGVTPAQIYMGGAEIGAIGHSVGFGLSGTGLTGFGGSYGTKRAMQNIIDVIVNFNGFVDPSGTILLSDFDSPAGNTNSLGAFGSSSTPLALEGMGAPGDSGGPVFILVGSSWFIAGVHSFIADLGPPIGNNIPDARYGDILGSTRVSSYAGWINSIVPEPTSVAALTVGLLGLMARRLRKVGKRASIS